ncbi:MAG: hypothetical protein KF888_00780 [Nitrosomonas sp.]|nr:hypothetical protein [Nitrosomonas sp.]
MKHAIAGFFVAIAVLGATLLFTGGRSSFFIVPAACCLSALIMPTTHALLGYISFFAVGGLLIFAQHLYVTSLPSYTGSPGEAVGLAFLVFIALGIGGTSILNLVCRFAFRKWQAAQQGAAGGVRNSRA